MESCVCFQCWILFGVYQLYRLSSSQSQGTHAAESAAASTDAKKRRKRGKKKHAGKSGSGGPNGSQGKRGGGSSAQAAGSDSDSDRSDEDNEDDMLGPTIVKFNSNSTYSKPSSASTMHTPSKQNVAVPVASAPEVPKGVLMNYESNHMGKHNLLNGFQIHYIRLNAS
jgi:hypothetical protein